MNEIEQTVHQAEDAVLINELRDRMKSCSDSNIQKLGILVLNLGADAQRIMAERNIAGAAPTTDEPPDAHLEADYEDRVSGGWYGEDV